MSPTVAPTSFIVGHCLRSVTPTLLPGSTLYINGVAGYTTFLAPGLVQLQLDWLYDDGGYCNTCFRQLYLGISNANTIATCSNFVDDYVGVVTLIYSTTLETPGCHTIYIWRDYNYFCNPNDGIGYKTSPDNSIIGAVYVNQPTSLPTGQPSALPSSRPSLPTSQPTGQPSSQPSSLPTSRPSLPTSVPSGQPSGQPSREPSSQPTGKPTSVPSSQPSGHPTSRPSLPTSVPSGQPSGQPTSLPSGQPSGQPTSLPSSQPSGV